MFIIFIDVHILNIKNKLCILTRVGESIIIIFFFFFDNLIIIMEKKLGIQIFNISIKNIKMSTS